MARRSKDTISPALIVLLFALAAVAVLAPFVLSAWLVVAEVRARRYHGAQRPADLITDAERSQVEASDRGVSRLENAIDASLRQGDAAGYQRRADGLFDARSTGARALNAKLEDLFAGLSEARLQAELVRAPLENRLEAWASARSQLIAARAALAVFALTFSAVIASQASAGAPFTLAHLLVGSGDDGGARLAASAVGAAAAAVAAWIGGRSARASVAL